MTKPGNEPGVITDLHDFLKWYMQTTLRFPKAHRVTLGDRIDNHLLDMIETAVRARYARDKRQLLHTLNIQFYAAATPLHGPGQYAPTYVAGTTDQPYPSDVHNLSSRGRRHAPASRCARYTPAAFLGARTSRSRFNEARMRASIRSVCPP